MGYLIKHSTDVNARDKQGNTPLNIVGNFHFNRSGDDDKITIAQILLDRGVDADHTNLFGYATLYCLAEDNMGRNMDLANLLIDHGTDVNDGNFIIAYGGDTVTITRSTSSPTNSHTVTIRGNKTVNFTVNDNLVNNGVVSRNANVCWRL